MPKERLVGVAIIGDERSRFGAELVSSEDGTIVAAGFVDSVDEARIRLADFRGEIRFVDRDDREWAVPDAWCLDHAQERLVFASPRRAMRVLRGERGDEPTPADGAVPRCCVRVLTGPLARAVFPVETRVAIGRSLSADIQLDAPEVSRVHAVVLRMGDGYTLLDMLSMNGTLVDGAPIEEKSIVPGDRFSVGGSELLFDELGAQEVGAAPELQPIALSVTRQPTRRIDAVPPELEPTETEYHASPSRARFSHSDGRPYAGNLLTDLMLYRNLRQKIIREPNVKESFRARFEELEEALRVPPRRAGEERRGFARFSCEVSGEIAFQEDGWREHEIRVQDIAVDGARITAPPVRVKVDGLCRLWLPARPDARTMVFSARVVWARAGEIGLVFSGAPSWSTHSGGSELSSTQPLRKILAKLR